MWMEYVSRIPWGVGKGGWTNQMSPRIVICLGLEMPATHPTATVRQGQRSTQ